MDASWRDKVEELFRRAIELPAEERAAFLEEASSDDAMRAAVVERIEHDERASASQADTIDTITPPTPIPTRGELIDGRYEVIGRLGAGGMGQVQKVRDTKVSGRHVALKRILHLDEQARLRFQREIDVAAHLNHRNICRIYECGEDEHGPYFTMELLKGGSLSDRVKRRGPLDSQAFVELARQLAQALRYAHRKGTQHRDIKPSNVLFAEDGDPKLADFGLARVGPSSDLSLSHHGLGTYEYSAPEQLRDSKIADHRADIYSLGATLYFALTGKPPVAVLDQSAIPAQWRTLILKCMQEDPADRYFDAGEILIHLEKTPATSSTIVSDKCGQCGAANPSGFSFCHQCGAGLNEPCPNCRAQNRAGDTMCHNCQIDIPKRRAADKLLLEAHAQIESGDYRRAAKAAREALRHEPDRDEVKAVLAEAQGALQRRAKLREAVEDLQSAKVYDRALAACRELIELDPDNDWAKERIEQLRGMMLDESFLELAKRVQSRIDDRDLPEADRQLQELRVIDAPCRRKHLPRTEQAVRRLHRDLVLEQRDAYEAALCVRDWKAVREAIGRLSDLGVDETEVAALLARLKVAQRTSRRWRAVRRVAASAAAIAVLLSAYLAVAGWHNAKIARRAADALAAGLDFDPAAERVLPGWPPDFRAALADRARLCADLDDRYGGAWRSEVAKDDAAVFHVTRSGEALMTAYNRFVLRRCVADPAAARLTLNKLELQALADRGFFERRRDAIQELLDAGHGALLTDEFADPAVVDPRAALVSRLETTIRDADTGIPKIVELSSVIRELGWGGDVEGSIGIHNQKVLVLIQAAVADGRTIDDLRTRIYDNAADDIATRVDIFQVVSDTLDDPSSADAFLSLGTPLGDACERLAGDLQARGVAAPDEAPGILAALVEIGRRSTLHQPRMDEAIGAIVESGNEQLFRTIENAFAAGSRAGVEDALATVDEFSRHWSGLPAEHVLRDRRTDLGRVHEHWEGGTPLPTISELCRLRDTGGVDGGGWAAFLEATETHAAGVLEGGGDAAAVAPYLVLLLELGHNSATLAGLATELTETALNTRAYTAARRVAALGRTARLRALHDIAADLERLATLDKRRLRNLRNGWPEGLVAARREVEAEISRRLAACLPAEGTTLTYPGRFEVRAGPYFVEAVTAMRDGDRVALSPAEDGPGVYDVPYRRGESVEISVTADGITVDRVFPLYPHRLLDFADVGFARNRVVEGDEAILEIRRAPGLRFVEIDGRRFEPDASGPAGDVRTLTLATSLAPHLPTDRREWDVRLVAESGIQDFRVALKIDSKPFSKARAAFAAGRYGDGFDELGGFASSRDEQVRRAVEHARDAWYAELEAARPRDRADADRLVRECDRFREHDPHRRHPGIGAIRDRTWLEGIELTTTWSSVDALERDLTTLEALAHRRDDVPPAAIDWLERAVPWGRPIVDHMARRPGDWSLDANGYPVLVHRDSGLEFVYVPGGTFRLGGTSDHPREQPHHRVTVSGFYISRTEVTNEAWDAGNPNSNEPKTMVSFADAQAWCHDRGLDLPTEAQWELAAGGEAMHEYPCGKRKCEANFHPRRKRDARFTEVATHDCDRSEWCGAMDMAGNVREWCYPVSGNNYRLVVPDAVDPPATGGVITRGGSFREPRDSGTSHQRVERFLPGDPAAVGSPDITIGFRPVLPRRAAGPSSPR